MHREVALAAAPPFAKGALAGPIGAIRARSSSKKAAAAAPPAAGTGSKGGSTTTSPKAEADTDNNNGSSMHRLPDPDVRRMPIAGPGGVDEPAGPCGAARRHAPAFFALLAVGLVATTVVTRHGQGGGGGGNSGGGGGGVGLPHLTGAGGAAGVRLSGGAPLGEDAYECLKGVDYEDFGSSFPGLSRRDCAAMCGAMPNCRVWSHDPTREGGLCTTRYDNYTSFYAPEVESCVQLAHNAPRMDAFLGVAHWQGCYFKTAKPFLLDGAEEVRRLGSKILKVAFNFHEPWNDYPWHSEWPVEAWRTWTPPPVEVAKHPYWQQLFSMDGFDTFILIAYSNVARSSPDPEDWKAWVDPWYWVYKEPTKQQLRDETEQFQQLAEHLLRTYPGKTFVLQMWEGDWTLRQDLPVAQRYNTTAPVAQAKADRMVKWLAARQAGVTRARKAVGAATTARVFHAAEVNLVRQAADDIAARGHSPRVDVVTAVLPRVALDMVSYSSYDSTLAPDFNRGAFWRSVRLVQRMHRRTAASPEKAVFVGEFGVNSMATDWDDVMEKVKSAVNVGAAAGLAYLVYWQMYDNALNPKGKAHYGIDKCDSRMVAKGPVYDQQYIEGFFIQHPDMEYYRPPATYWRKMLAGETDDVRHRQ